MQRKGPKVCGKTSTDHCFPVVQEAFCFFSFIIAALTFRQRMRNTSSPNFAIRFTLFSVHYMTEETATSDLIGQVKRRETLYGYRHVGSSPPPSREDDIDVPVTWWSTITTPAGRPGSRTAGRRCRSGQSCGPDKRWRTPRGAESIGRGPRLFSVFPEWRLGAAD